MLRAIMWMLRASMWMLRIIVWMLRAIMYYGWRSRRHGEGAAASGAVHADDRAAPREDVRVRDVLPQKLVGRPAPLSSRVTKTFSHEDESIWYMVYGIGRVCMGGGYGLGSTS
eukprot:3906096-Pyramimonas_sp.AAC.1